MSSYLEVIRSSNCFEEIVTRIALALVLMDKDNRIIHTNQRAEALFGYSSSEMLNHSVDMLVPQGQLHWSIAVDQLLGHDVFALRKDGVSIPVELTVSSIQCTFGVCFLASFADNSARRHADAVEQQMTAIIESAEDAILTKSLDGVIRSWNPGAERLLGYRAEEVIGGPVTRLIPPALHDEEAGILSRLRQGGRVEHFETIRRKRDGTNVHVSLTISPIRDRAGTVVGASKIMRDISRQKAAEETLRRSNVELERLNTELDEFVYTASHDLRSPLTNVGRVAQWIIDDDAKLSAQTVERLLLIQGRIERMERLLSDIREYARSGNVEEIAGPTVSAAALLAEVVESLHIPPGFSVKLDPFLDSVRVKGNPLARVFHNLIDNAIKHHDEPLGRVQVTVDSNRPAWRFSVCDDGPGVPGEYRDEIFSMFKTLKPRDLVEGSGMGLALVKKIVSRMGGVCGAGPIHPRGAELWFDWPKLTETLDSTL
jgi:PAS domain S-box-containing protein